MVTHTTNPTKIIEIPQSAISVLVTRNCGGELESIQISRLDLEPLKSLPPSSPVWLIAKAKFTEIEVDLGTLASPLVPKSVPLGNLDRTRPLHIRVFAFDPNTKQILASCERLSTYDSAEGNLQSLLPVEPLDLGEQLWRLQAENDERPILQISNDTTLGLLERLKGDPFVQAMILPAALEQVFRYLQTCDAVDEDAEDWKARWRRFLEQIGCPFPEAEGDEFDMEWAKTATVRACQFLKLKSRAVQSMELEN